MYRSSWRGWRDWCGRGTRDYLPYAEARAVARSLGLNGQKEWQKFCVSGEKPTRIPTDPVYHYGSQFQGWGDWLGTDRIATFNRQYLPYAKSRAYVRTLGLEGVREWHHYCRSGNKPSEIPANPRQVYESEFRGWGDC